MSVSLRYLLLSQSFETVQLGASLGEVDLVGEQRFSSFFHIHVSWSL